MGTGKAKASKMDIKWSFTPIRERAQYCPKSLITDPPKEWGSWSLVVF